MPVEWELIKLACVETDTVLSGAVKIHYQILTSFIMYSFLMQGNQLVLEVRLGYDYVVLQYSPHHSNFCTFTGWLLEGGRSGSSHPVPLSVSDKAALICIPCNLWAELFGIWKWEIVTVLLFNLKFMQCSSHYQRGFLLSVFQMPWL